MGAQKMARFLFINRCAGASTSGSGRIPSGFAERSRNDVSGKQAIEPLQSFDDDFCAFRLIRGQLRPKSRSAS